MLKMQHTLIRNTIPTGHGSTQVRVQSHKRGDSCFSTYTNRYIIVPCTKKGLLCLVYQMVKSWGP